MARLESFYVKIRQEVQVAATEAEALGRAPRAVPITVRLVRARVRVWVRLRVRGGLPVTPTHPYLLNRYP